MYGWLLIISTLPRWTTPNADCRELDEERELLGAAAQHLREAEGPVRSDADQQRPALGASHDL